MIELDGPNGRFTITPVGGRAREAPNGYLYQDSAVRLVFYSRPVWLDGGAYDLEVVYAESDKFRNDIPLVPTAHRQAIMNNIRLFFMSRRMIPPYNEWSASERRPSDVVFSWFLRP